MIKLCHAIKEMNRKILSCWDVLHEMLNLYLTKFFFRSDESLFNLYIKVVPAKHQLLWWIQNDYQKLFNLFWKWFSWEEKCWFSPSADRIRWLNFSNSEARYFSESIIVSILWIITEIALLLSNSQLCKCRFDEIGWIDAIGDDVGRCRWCR